uniref:Secreted protein n=1 Tax=Echinococcus granulosus TaxID=6210 RepID=A0A068X2E3_ECHGR|nr:hypothetical protein EgrG_002000800 [Echinococcus granulosus]
MQWFQFLLVDHVCMDLLHSRSFCFKLNFQSLHSKMPLFKKLSAKIRQWSCLINPAVHLPLCVQSTVTTSPSFSDLQPKVLYALVLLCEIVTANILRPDCTSFSKSLK